MESLNKLILDFNAVAKGDDGSCVPFSLQVMCPEYDEDRGFFCQVSCRYFRVKPFLIFGVDEIQACELAIDFIRLSLIDRAELVDANGHPISLPVIEWPPLD